MAAILKKLLISLLFLGSFSLIAEVKWQTNLKKAQDKADKEGKDIFVYFTGSDWCSYCIMLHKQVFDKDNFLVKLEKDYVLLKLDFPQRKPLPKIESQLNNRHSLEYSVEGFPTVLLLDKDGRAFAKTGFKAGGPTEYAAHLAALRVNKAKRDKAFESAEKLTGIDRSQEFIKALNFLGDVPRRQYKNIQNEIVKNDPEDKTGYQRDVLTKQALSGLEAKVLKLVESQKLKEALALVDSFIAEKSPEGETKQKALLFKVYTYSKSSDNLDEVEKLMDLIISIEPNSEAAEDAKGIKIQIAEMNKANKEK